MKWDESLDSIIKKAVKNSLAPHVDRHVGQAEKISLDIDKSVVRETVKESYVAEAKPFGQVTEFLSQKAKDAHVALYKGTVTSINKISAELDAVDRNEVNSQHNAFRSLKLDETYNLNSVWLHELFFAASFQPHSEIYMDSIAYLRLERDFGNFDDFQKDLMACALACGEGWAVCGYHMFLKRYVNVMISNNSQDMMLGLYPVIVIDMHAHAYYRDYLTDKKSYLISRMREIDWGIIEERVKKAESIVEVMK
jgi:Fe-Mn family superoxide dismutase